MEFRTIILRFWEDIVLGEKPSFLMKIAGFVLLAASFVYIALAGLQRNIARKKRLPRPVVSVGNITAGGTGKTPAVESICRILLDMGRRPAVVSRGYMGKSGSRVSVVSGGAGGLLGPDEAGDEPVMLAASLPGVPVLTGKKRYEAGIEAVEKHGAGVVVLDDGFQHYFLHRDIDIITLDSTRPFGSGYVIPRGDMRELPSRLREADIVILTRTELCGNIDAVKRSVRSVAPAAVLVESVNQPVCLKKAGTGEEFSADFLKGRRAVVFSGIGNSRGFEKNAAALGIEPVECLRYPDHHRYSREDLKSIVRLFRERGAGCALTTAKDWARLGTGAVDCLPEETFVLVSRMRFTAGAERLTGALEGLFAEGRGFG